MDQWFVNHLVCELMVVYVTEVGLVIENGVWVCAALKTPFSRPPGPHFSIFQFSRPYFHPKLQISQNLKLHSFKISKEFSG